METKELTIPHIGIPERDFVLQPLCDISPDFIHPQLHMSMKELLQKIPQEKRTL